MVRGRHIDVTILGALQVAANGDLANWIVPGKMVKGMGGAMDLVGSGNRVIVTMEHCTRAGGHKILEACDLPLTGKAVVDMIITELGVFVCDKETRRLTLTEIADGVELAEVREKTGADFDVADPLPAMRSC